MKLDYKTEYNRYKRYYRDLSPFLKSPVVKAYTMLILSLLTMSLFGFFAIRPTIKTIVGLNKEITDARKVDKALQNKINQLSDAQQEFTKIQPELPLINSALPPQSEFQSLLMQIESAASQNGATISGIQFQSVALLGSIPKKSSLKDASSSAVLLSEIPFRISFNGTFKNLSDLINKIGRLERLIGIESINISSNSALEGNLTITLSAKAYIFPE
jgi:Tfp pilus assembly protein PilO